jgi:hypothetical protein
MVTGDSLATSQMHMPKLAMRTASGLRAGDGLALFANGVTGV